MRTRWFGETPWSGAIPWTQASAWSGVTASSGAVRQQLRPIVMARTEKTNHDISLDKDQNTCRVRGCRRPWNSPPGAADVGTPGLRTLHRDLAGRSLRGAA